LGWPEIAVVAITEICCPMSAFYVMSQRPLAGVALSKPASNPAWRSRPVWGYSEPPTGVSDLGVHRFSYDRMGATVTEIEGASQVVTISHPKEVAGVVMSTVHKVS
jgi:hypothetical protein